MATDKSLNRKHRQLIRGQGVVKKGKKIREAGSSDSPLERLQRRRTSERLWNSVK